MSDTLLPHVLLWSSLAVAVAWLARGVWRTGLVAACGAGLLAMVSPLSLAGLGAATLLTYGIARRWAASRVALGLGLAAIAGAYIGFLATGPAAGAGIGTAVALPVGMAFYSLRLIHYLVEAHKGTLRRHGVADYLAYQLLPSALPAGPIHRFDDFLRDLGRHRWDAVQFSAGLGRVLHGLVKIVVIGHFVVGQRIAPALAEAAAAPGLEGAWVGALLLWLELYVLFSGYSDVAIGFGALMGFRLRENFRWPFLARNIADFWQRWHVSLASWCRDYVFMPVQAVTRNHVLALLAAMVVLGLWHELSLRYLLWGAYHGLGIAVFRAYARQAAHWRAPAALQWLARPAATLLTLNFVLLSFPVTTAVEQGLRRWI